MSSSSSSPKTTTTTSDLRTTNTLNAGLEGDISDSFVAAGNYGATTISSATNNSDNSLKVDMTDTSDRSNNWADNSDNSLNLEMIDSSNRSTNDYSDRSHYQTSEFSDYSDNSLTVEMVDESDRSTYVDSSTTNVTDGGAFELVHKLGGEYIESLGESQKEALGVVDKVVANGYGFVKESQNTLLGAVEKLVTKAIDSSTDIANKSLQGAMQIKAGQTVTEPVNQTMRELASTATKIAVVGGAIYLGSKFIGGRA